VSQPDGRLPLLSARPAVTPATFKEGCYKFCCLVNITGTVGVNSLPKTVTRQRSGCDLNPGPSAPESSTLTTRLPSHPKYIHTYCISASPSETYQIRACKNNKKKSRATAKRTADVPLTRSRVSNLLNTNIQCGPILHVSHVAWSVRYTGELCENG